MIHTIRRTAPAAAAAIGALALVALLVVRTSQAAFTATTANSGNRFAAGTVVLTDNDGGTALIDVTATEPGDIVSGCITVTYSGDIVDPSPVHLYLGAALAGTGAATLPTYLNLDVWEYPAGCADATGAVSIFSNTLESFRTNNTSYATGVGTWDPTTGDSMSYQIQIELDPATPDSEQGLEVSSLTFQWEIQN